MPDKILQIFRTFNVVNWQYLRWHDSVTSFAMNAVITKNFKERKIISNAEGYRANAGDAG